jgi:hypothetical protein
MNKTIAVVALTLALSACENPPAAPSPEMPGEPITHPICPPNDANCVEP